VTGVQVTSRRWREATAIRELGLQIADFRLPEALFNLKSSILKSSIPKRLLLFDIDGTLINSAGAGLQALRDVLQDQFGITDDLEGIEVAGRTDSGIVHQILRKQKIEPNETNTARFLDQYLELLAQELPQRPGFVLPGAKELLLRLRERSHIVLALLTGNVERGAKLKLEHYGLWQFFEFGAFADDHHDRNELGAFARRRARERHGVEFASAAIDVIGDTPHDIACGKAIGARTVAVTTGSFTREQLAAHQPDLILDDFSDVEVVLAELGW
jgi:phosphoglycolate phosphatase